MPSVEITTQVSASIEIVFDLCRSIDLHIDSQRRSQERAIEGRTMGLIELGEVVTWSAQHFGFRLRHEARITAYDRPRQFQDTMIRGMFRSFVHDHSFLEIGGKTKVTDVVNFESPLGILGRAANELFLCDYLKRLLIDRMNQIKAVAESAEWMKYLNDA